jgi:hypothetical protein
MSIFIEFDPELEVNLREAKCIRRPSPFDRRIFFSDLQKQRIVLVFRQVIEAAQIELSPLPLNYK